MNVFTFSGNLGKDAETRYTNGSNPTPVTSFSVACTSGWGDKQTTTWIRCNAWGERYEKLAQYLTKGKKVCVSGELSTREYEGKTYIELRVNDLDLPPKSEPAGQVTQSQSTGRGNPGNLGSGAPQQASAPDFSDDEKWGDIPFSNYEYKTLA